ncbi:MAG: helix-turn-helix domain-containing protein, partial [Syntrophobacteraceae bacterium]|nr:helix-turn-helix domain-containing protein [Syntrophobacteraceae bacterium]
LHGPSCPPVHTEGLTLVDFERNTILNALDRNGWRRMATARELGIDKNTLRRKIKRLNIVREEAG